MCASISPGIRVRSPRSMTSAPAGCLTEVPDFDDALAFDQNLSRLHDLAVLHIQQARGVEDDGCDEAWDWAAAAGAMNRRQCRRKQTVRIRIWPAMVSPQRDGFPARRCCAPRNRFP